jgi:outer membrane protein assembly factor BamA
VALTLVAACQPAPPAHPAVAAPCLVHRISRVTVSGAAPDAVPQLTVLEGALDEPDRTARIAEVALGALRAEGYADARLAVRRRPGCGVELAVAVALGPRYRIASIAFATDDAFPAAARLAVIEDALGTINTLGGVYVEYRLVRALAQLERRYHDAGWLEARIGAPRATYARGEVAIAIPVTAGPRYRIGAIRVVGADPAARPRIAQALGLQTGDYYDGARVRTAIERARHGATRRVELRATVADDRPVVDVDAVVEGAR